MVRWPGFPFPRTDSSCGFSDGYAERGEAVQDGHTDLELGDLTVEVSRSQTLAFVNTAAMNAHLAEIARSVAPFVGEMIPRIMS